MPKNISISFDTRYRASPRFSNLAINRQEVTVSDIPLVVGNIHMNSDRFAGAIHLVVASPDDDITLADGTLISFDLSSGWFLHGLSIYKECGQWKLIGRMGVVMPGESTPVVYGSVTFEAGWGNFIEGE